MIKIKEIKAMDTTVAKEIMNQINSNRLSVMIGVSQWTAHEDGVSFKFKAGTVANYCKIKLDYSKDLYNMEIKKIGRAPNFTIKDVDTMEGLYNDQLMSHFERVTGLATRL